jgi:hypothetical protein
VPAVWFLAATGLIGAGAWLGYWLASKTEIPFLRSLSKIVNTRRLHDAVARLLLAAGALIGAWEHRLRNWTWGRLALWLLRTEDESR